MQKNLKAVFDYFSYFSYAPSFSEIHTFYPSIISKKTLQTILSSACKRNILVRLPNNIDSNPLHSSNSYTGLRNLNARYTLPQYSIPTLPRLSVESKNISFKVTGTIQFYLSLLKRLPLVQFVGMTGKSAMEGYRKNDDIDLFIVTQSGFLWTTRFLMILLAKLLRIHGGNGVCLNLFFDERDLIIPAKKQNEYIAHELLQMKPIVSKGTIYGALLEANRWIFSIFPNSRSVIPAKAGFLSPLYGEIQTLISIQKKVIFDWIPSSEGMTHIIDKLFKSIQLPIIKKNKTAFRITPTQLWLFKQDFEKKLKKKDIR